MRKIAIALVLLVCAIAWPYNGHAKNSSPVMTKKQFSKLIADVYKAPAKKFLLKDLNGPDKRGFRVVYVFEGTRYTLDHNWWVDGVQIWIRPDGTSHPNPPANALSDGNSDGMVNSGSDGRSKIFAVVDYYKKGSPPEGLEHQAYWQSVCKEALKGLAATVNK